MYKSQLALNYLVSATNILLCVVCNFIYFILYCSFSQCKSKSGHTLGKFWTLLKITKSAYFLMTSFNWKT